MSTTTAHPLDSRWYLTKDEICEWIRILRVLRIKARDKVQPLLDGAARTSDLAKMRVDVCEFLTASLKEILEAYWAKRIQASSEETVDFGFFFSPGYRPYGRDRAPLETPQGGELTEGELHLQALGRHSTLAPSGFFGLATWMHFIYEQKIGRCKIGGFTDWFGQFDTVALTGEMGGPLVALVISASEKAPGILHCANSIVRCCLAKEISTPADKFLNDFEGLLRDCLGGFRFQRRTKEGKLEDVEIAAIIPYPPAYVWRKDRWVKVDLQNFTLCPDDEAKEQLPTQSQTPPDDEEKKELVRAKMRFACLFQAIFGRVTVPEALLQDETTKRILKELQEKQLLFYPYYHVFVTDQDLALDRERSSSSARIGSKLGTLNLYTQYPICDTGVGLIRDTLESIYDTVRDAEILTEFARKPYHPDPVIRDWLEAYVRPWIDHQLRPWGHNEIDAKWQYYANILSDLFGGSLRDLSNPAALCKRLFMTDRNISGAIAHGEIDSGHPIGPKYLQVIWHALGFSDILLEYPVSEGWTFRAPRSPAATFFLSLRNLVWMMTLDGGSAPTSVVFAECQVKVFLDHKTGMKISGTGRYDPRAHENRFRSKKAQGKLANGLCGGIHSLSLCAINESAGRAMLTEEEDCAIALFRGIGSELRIVWEDNAFSLVWV